MTRRAVLNVRRVWPKDGIHPAHLIIAREGIALVHRLYTRNDILASWCDTHRHQDAIFTWNEKGTLLALEPIEVTA